MFSLKCRALYTSFVILTKVLLKITLRKKCGNCDNEVKNFYLDQKNFIIFLQNHIICLNICAMG